MTKTELQEEVLGLPAEQRAELAQTLWKSLDTDIPVYPWQEEALAAALAEHEKNPDNVVPGDEVFARLRARHDHRA